MMLVYHIRIPILDIMGWTTTNDISIYIYISYFDTNALPTWPLGGGKMQKDVGFTHGETHGKWSEHAWWLFHISSK